MVQAATGIYSLPAHSFVIFKTRAIAPPSGNCTRVENVGKALYQPLQVEKALVNNFFMLKFHYVEPSLKQHK